MSTKTDHAVRQDLERPSGSRSRRRHLPALYRPPSGPRGDLAAGLRRPARDRPQGSRAGEDAGGGRPQHPDHRSLQAQSRSGKHRADAGDGGERQRIRHRILQRVRQASGHRPRHRPRAGLYAARHHHRLRRQPHLDAWRVRRAGARHRHLGSRARAGDADADPEEGQEHARRRRRQVARRRHRQGHHPRDHRRDRHRRRHRLRAGICRRGDPRALDGRPHDGLQHVDRGRRPRRPDRAGSKRPSNF